MPALVIVLHYVANSYPRISIAFLVQEKLLSKSNENFIWTEN